METNKSKKNGLRSSHRGRLFVAGFVVLAAAAGMFWALPQSQKEQSAGGQREDRTDMSAAKSALSSATQSASVEHSPILAESSSDPRAATIRIGAVKGVLTPNARGEFPQLPIEASATVEASVPFPEAKPGERIGIQSEDGGRLVGDAAKGFSTIDESHQVSLRYQAAAHDGLYRVALRRGGERRVLKFWVGPEPPILARQ